MISRGLPLTMVGVRVVEKWGGEERRNMAGAEVLVLP